MNPTAAVIVDALEAIFSATNNYHHGTRALRNRLIVMTLVALASATALVLLQWRIPSVHMIAKPDNVKNIATWQLLLMVMGFGAVGALLTTIRPISTLPPSNSPFNFPLQQAFLKIVVGTLTATIGVVAVSGATGSKGLTSLSALLFTATAFGASQQAVTRMLDDRAAALISTSPSTPSTS